MSGRASTLFGSYSAASNAASSTSNETSSYKESNIRNLEHLSECALNARLRFSETRRCIELATGRSTSTGKIVWKPVGGLLDRLRECFYPHYDFHRSEAIARKHERRRKAENDVLSAEGVEAAHPALLEEERRLGKRARELGEHVDQEHSALVNQPLLTGLAAAAAIATEAPMELSLYTKLLLKAKSEWQWTSYIAQFIVCAPELSIGTCIDELCYDKDHHLLVIEHKVGYKSYAHHGTAMMNEPLEDIVNSPENQHILQCGFGLIMLERYWDVRVHMGFVVYITNSQTRAVPLPEWFFDRKEALWARFVEQMNRRLH